MSIKKLFFGLAVVALALTATVSVAGAQTTDLSALLAQIATLQAQIAALSGSSAGSAPSTTFTRDLTIGSSGADVTALQTWLLGQGESIPAGATGYFGAQTKAALASYQAKAGISPASGYFGPITRSKLASLGGGGVIGGNLPAGCTSTSGYSVTTGQSCAGGSNLPAGCTSAVGYSPTTGQSCSGAPSGQVVDGSDGSVTLSFSPYVTTSQTLKKGDMDKGVLSVKLQATGGPVSVQRFDVHFSERPWLDFAKVTLKDNSGNVLSTKVLSGSGDATEVTVGSDYLVRFDGLNVNVKPGTDTILIVSIDVLAASDKITGQTVSIGLDGNSIRTINGKGYTDSIGLTTGSGAFGGTPNTVTLSSTGSAAAIYTSISASSPAKRIVTTSASQTTNDVTLAVFSLKSQNQDATINNLGIMLNATTTVATTTWFQNVRLVDSNGTSYGAANLSSGTTFTNLNINLPKDQWKDLKVVADVLSGTSGVSASTTLDASTISGVDANFNSLTISGSDVTANDVTFLTTGVNVSSASTQLGSLLTLPSGSTSVTSGQQVTFNFTLQNTGDSPVYVGGADSSAATLLATSTSGSTGGSTASSTVDYVVASPGSIPGDTSTAYIIPQQSSRSFTLTGKVSKTAGSGSQTTVLKITGIYFFNSSTVTSTSTAQIVNFGLEALDAHPTL